MGAILYPRVEDSGNKQERGSVFELGTTLPMMSCEIKRASARSVEGRTKQDEARKTYLAEDGSPGVKRSECLADVSLPRTDDKGQASAASRNEEFNRDQTHL